MNDQALDREHVLARDALRSADAIDDSSELLLADFLANVLAAPRTSRITERSRGGVAGSFAARSHSRDLDDVYWPGLVHPGSMIWAVVVGHQLTSRLPVSRSGVLHAASVGYQVMADLALELAGSASRWHLSSLTGGAGVAATTVLLDNPEAPEHHVSSAIGLAATMAGGTPRALLTRTAIGGFQRAAAVTGGILAARAAADGVRPPPAAFEGAGGLWAAIGHERAARPVMAPTSAIMGTSPRLYPANGYAQAAILAAEGLARDDDRCTDYTLRLPPGTLRASSADGGWWDTPAAARRALATGDAWRDGDAVTWRGKLRVDSDATIPVGHAALGPTGTSPAVTAPPGLPLDEWRGELERKWLNLGQDPGAVHELCAQVMSDAAPSAAEQLGIMNKSGP